jgi:NADH:ubiquinone oxidoreductase subunit 2 (subunit N)
LEAVFPFHTWVPMLSEHAHPFAFTFVLFILPMAIGLVSLKYINIFSQLSIAPGLYSSLRIVGAFLVIIGGVGAAFQNHLGRILGFAVITQIGLSMLTFSLRADRSFDPLFLGIFFAQLFPQGLGLAIWGLSLHIIHTDRGSLSFRKVQGTAQQLPFASSSLAISNLSLAGLPLLASFPVYVIIWSSLSVQAASIALLSLVGIAFLLIAAIRSIAVLVMNPEQQPWTISENRFQLILLSLGGLALLVVGLMPQIILPQLINMAFIYGNTGP